MTTTQLRYIGMLPLIGFAIHFQSLLRRGVPDEALWTCYASTLALALALFSGRSLLIAPTGLCVVIGFWIWLVEVFLIHEFTWTSICTHLVGFVTAVYVLRRIQLPALSWLYAIGWGFFVQQLARLMTEPGKNINAAHRVYAGMDTLLPNYAIFWTASCLACAAALWTAQKLLGGRYADPFGLRTQLNPSKS